MTWEAAPDNLNLNFNIYSYSPSYNFDIDFGDGTILMNQTQAIQHSYSQPGIYYISISGVFPQLNLDGYTRANVLSVEQWGNIVWNSMASMFSNCNDFTINATDTPNLSQVTDTSFMFNECVNFNQSINNWDVSNITNMVAMFHGCTSFNQPLNSWDVSSVTTLSQIFQNASNFNQSLDSWDVSNVTDMSNMFSDSSSYNQLLNSWDVSSVSNMNQMFNGATSFNQPIGNWNTSSLTELVSVFQGATSFNQLIDSWDISNVTNMTQLFYQASNYNQPIDIWDVSNVTNMSTMFANASSFNQPLNNWDVSNVDSMWSMFFSASDFNQPLDNWNTSSVNSMYEMFENATSFDQDLSSWDFSNISYAYGWGDMLSYSNLSVYHYDKLLSKLASTSITNINLGVHGLDYCDSNARNHLIYSNGWYFTGDSYSLNCNSIIGSVYYDLNNDGCNVSDIEVSNLLVKAEDANLFNISSIVTNSSYEIPVHTGSQTVYLTNLPDYFTATPQSETVDFLTTSTEQVDFCLTANQTIEDLNITILPINSARPGFEANYKLVIENVGTQTVNNASATLIFDDSMQSFVSATPSPAATTANTLDFNMASLAPFASQEIAVTMQTFTPPTVNGDDVLNFTANVLPDTNDYTPIDNSYGLEQIVVNSFDPNDKRVLQGGEITLDEVGEYLDYIVRFQNTGSASAINVRIEDDLHPNLDWSTLRITSASHTYNVEITNGNEAEFIFDNINLPYEATNEPASHGFIAYKIKPKSAIQLGDVMSGNASIYFDYNQPIITNIVMTEVVNLLSIVEYSANNLLSIYPNPADEGIYIKTKPGVTVKSAKIYNLQGSQLLDIESNMEYVNTKKMATGIYMLIIETNKGNITKRLIVN